MKSDSREIAADAAGHAPEIGGFTVGVVRHVVSLLKMPKGAFYNGFAVSVPAKFNRKRWSNIP
jgi:hypothetical protein